MTTIVNGLTSTGTSVAARRPAIGREMLDARWVTADTAGVGIARRDMARALTVAGLPADQVLLIEQVAGELLANAVIHGCRRPGDRPFLRVLRDEGGVLVEIEDRGDSVPAASAPSLLDEHGRGLALVAALTDAWGVTTHEGTGKTVWALVSEI